MRSSPPPRPSPPGPQRAHRTQRWHREGRLSVPREMGRPATAAPEDAFAAGNAACFGGALAFAGKKHRCPANPVASELAVKLSVEDRSLPRRELGPGVDGRSNLERLLGRRWHCQWLRLMRNGLARRTETQDWKSSAP
jgi:hypothetical protein